MKNKFDFNSDSMNENADELMMTAARLIKEQEIEKLNKANNDYADIEFPESLDREVYALFDTFDKKKNVYKKIKLFSKVAAIVILSLGIFTIGLYSTSEAFRIQILDWLFISHDEYDDVRINNDDVLNENAVVDEKTDGQAERFPLKMNYIPKGYVLVQQNTKKLEYKCKNNESSYIILRELESNGNLIIDNEQSINERIFRNGYEIELRVNGDNLTALWENSGKSFYLFVVGLNRDSFIKIIEGIELLNN